MDLVSWLNDHDDIPLVSSALVEVEVPRALRRSAPQALIGVPAAVGTLAAPCRGFLPLPDGGRRLTASCAPSRPERIPSSQSAASGVQRTRLRKRAVSGHLPTRHSATHDASRPLFQSGEISAHLTQRECA